MSDKKVGWDDVPIDQLSDVGLCYYLGMNLWFDVTISGGVVVIPSPSKYPGDNVVTLGNIQFNPVMNPGQLGDLIAKFPRFESSVNEERHNKQYKVTMGSKVTVADAFPLAYCRTLLKIVVDRDSIMVNKNHIKLFVG